MNRIHAVQIPNILFRFKAFLYIKVSIYMEINVTILTRTTDLLVVSVV